MAKDYVSFWQMKKEKTKPSNKPLFTHTVNKNSRDYLSFSACKSTIWQSLRSICFYYTLCYLINVPIALFLFCNTLKIRSVSLMYWGLKPGLNYYCCYYLYVKKNLKNRLIAIKTGNRRAGVW
jgi:hypothetical protein